MKLSHAKCYALAYPEPNDNDAVRYTLVVKLETTDGLTGWGEAVAMWPEAVKAVARLIDEGLFNVIRGSDPNDLSLWERLRAHTWWYGRGGIASMAIAALDIALWDLRAKSANKPLHVLLGGLKKSRLPACASIHPAYASITDNVQEIERCVQDGYRFVKFGFGKRGLAALGKDPDYDLDFVRCASRAAGSEVKLIVDFGNAVHYSKDCVLRLAREFVSLSNVLWLEEPFQPHEFEQHRAVRSDSGLLIGAGERDSTVEQYTNRIASDSVDILGIDPARAEGVTSFVQIAQAAHAAGMHVNAHAWSTAITSAASLALSLSVPNAIMFEFKPRRNPMQHELVVDPICPVQGWALPQSTPGIGVDVIERVLSKYQLT